MKKVILSIFILIGMLDYASAQGSGEIQGRVVNEKGEGIPFANVVVFRNDIQENGSATDYEGYFSIKPLSPGTYKVVASYLGNNVAVNEVSVSASRTTFLDDIMISTSQQLETVEVTYEEPAIDQGKPETGNTMNREQIDKMPKNNLVGIIGNTAATYQGDDDQLISIAGARGYGTKYMIDGVDLTGIVDLPNDAIDEVQIITGGVDASQGDFTGGVVSVSTRGPSNKLFGTAEFLSSELTDPYGYNEGRFSLLGPLMKQFKGTDSARTNLGFLVTGEFLYERESDPPGIPIYYVNDEKLEELKANPLIPSQTGEGFNKATEYVLEEDMVSSYVRKNNDDWAVNLFGKLDYKPTLQTNLTVGGTYYHRNNNANVRVFEMYNSENNPKSYRTDYRVYGKFTQRFRGARESEETTGYNIGNAYYTIQLSYQFNEGRSEDRKHKDNTFDYGHVGKFNTSRRSVYGYGQDSVLNARVYRLLGYADDGVTFEPGTANPVLSRYTEQYYEAYDPSTLSDVVLGGGLRNGDFTQSLYSYSMWYNPGVPYTSYARNDNKQFGGRFDASFDLTKSTEDLVNKHSIEFGFEYQQRIERNYSVAPYSNVGIWGLARQVTNFHLNNLDVGNPYFLVEGDTVHHTNYNQEIGEFDSVFYYRRYDRGDQTYFDIQLRKKLGLPVDGLDYIDVDNVDPDMLSLDMFSPTQLLNSGNRLVNARGYDYSGNPLEQAPTFADFFYDYEDVNGNGEFDFGDYRTRNIDAYRPIYTGAYIQDRFNIGRVLFRVGLRVDRFDANQKVLRDPYSLYPIRTAGEVDEIQDVAVTHPETIGDDFAVYVNDVQTPNAGNAGIVGYRDGDTWYNAEGTEISNPAVLANQTTTGVISPYLVDPNTNIKDPNSFDVDASFVDYDPQYTAMPRIAFSFPITETAMFTAHYDVLTQRPTGRNEATPYHYYYLEELATDATIPNANLRPEKTINYQLGFQQALTEKSALKISAFYREMRDMMQVTKIYFAYPVDYRTYGNVDFGTVKGLTVTYDMVRRVKNIMLTAAYTLQFADGTGSNTTSQLGLINANQPNLRTIVPLNNDVRHQINVDVDYRFPGGEAYQGPVIGESKIFANSGFSLQMRGRSGEPYTRQAQPTPTAQFGVASRSQLLGSINGSRLPFSFKMDLRIDKDFPLKAGKRNVMLNVYLVSQNLLNSKNVRGVYSYTGDPTDDGYLSSPVSNETIRAQVDEQAFIDQYRIKMRNPGNFSLPRRVQIGAKLKF